MQINTSKSRFVLGLTIGCAVGLLGAGLAIKFFWKGQRNPPPPILLRQGFDFQMLRAKDNKWRGPDAGEKIDLSLLKATNGSALKDLVGEQLTLLASVNPACRLCKTSRDEMTTIREQMTQARIPYHAVMFARGDSQADFDVYARTLGFNSPSFEWVKNGSSPPDSITSMTVPSHILIDKNGVVLRVWPGSYNDAEVRVRMARQILDDILLITEVLNGKSQSVASTR